MAIEVAEIKKQLQLILHDSSMVNEYLRQFGPVISGENIASLKAEIAKRTRRRNDKDNEGKDPVFVIKMTCPVCAQENLTGYELRAKAQQITQNRFLVPLYKGAFGYRTADYTLLAVTVCPRCLFASPDKKDFSRPATETANETKSSLSNNLIIMLQEKIGDRRALISGISDYAAYFSNPRTDQAAIDSYRLAIARAKLETWFEMPYAYYKLGAYLLRIAKILKDGGLDNSEHLKSALASFEESFRVSDCPAEEMEMQVMYTIAALAAKLGDRKKSKVYTSVFRTIFTNNKTREKEPVTENTAPPALIKLWDDKISLIQDSFDDPDFFKDE